MYTPATRKSRLDIRERSFSRENKDIQLSSGRALDPGFRRGSLLGRVS